MLADGATITPIETARAALQEKIADFLAARARLIRLMNSPSLQIKGQAQSLYAQQVQLENQLQNEITPKVQAIQAGTWTFSDVVALGSFTANIANQIAQVNQLESVGGSVQTPSMFGAFDMNTVLKVGAGLALATVVVSGIKNKGYLL